MLKTKYAVSALLLAGVLICSTGSAIASTDTFRPDNEDLYLDAVNNVTETKYNTVEVKRGNFVINASGQAYVNYENVSYVTNTITSGTVKYSKYLVDEGTPVKKGDPILEVTVTHESEELDELRSQIQTLEDNLESYADTNKALLSKYRNIIETSGNYEQRRTAQLLYNRLEASYNTEYENRSIELNRLRNRLAEGEELLGPQYIKASSDGIVNNIQHFWPEQQINPWSFLCIITDTSKANVIVTSNSELLRYNMPVQIVQATGKSNISVNGRVVTCNSTAISPVLSAGQTIVEILGDPSQFSLSNDISIKFKSVTADNVILVDKRAVNSDSKGEYVFLLENNHCFKRYIITGGSNASDYWVISGIDEGDYVVLK